MICESCLFSQGKTPEFTNMGEIHELFALALSLVWFAGATPESTMKTISSKTKGPGEQGAAGYCTKILLRKRAKMVSAPSTGVIGKSALEIGHFLRRSFWMISGSPFLSRPLCCTAENNHLALFDRRPFSDAPCQYHGQQNHSSLHNIFGQFTLNRSYSRGCSLK